MAEFVPHTGDCTMSVRSPDEPASSEGHAPCLETPLDNVGPVLMEEASGDRGAEPTVVDQTRTLRRTGGGFQDAVFDESDALVIRDGRVGA